MQNMHKFPSHKIDEKVKFLQELEEGSENYNDSSKKGGVDLSDINSSQAPDTENDQNEIDDPE